MQTITLLSSFRRGNSWVALKPLGIRRLSAIKKAMGYTTHLSNSLWSLFQVYIKCNYYYAVAICYTKMLLCGSHRLDRANKLYLNFCHLYGFEGIDKLDRRNLLYFLSILIKKRSIIIYCIIKRRIGFSCILSCTFTNELQLKVSLNTLKPRAPDIIYCSQLKNIPSTYQA